MALPEETFIGRARELAALAGAFHARPGVAIVEGPGGIGKTSVVQRFVAGDVRTWSAGGDRDEKFLPFGVADQLVRRAGGDSVLGETDHVSVGLQLLALLDRENPPDLLVVDDAHWADEASLRALLFAVRRLVAEPLLVVLVTRNAALLPEGLQRVAGTHVGVEPMTADEIGALAAAVNRPLSIHAARRLSEHTGGIPLHARALLDEMPAQAQLGPVLPVPRSYREVIESRLSGCSPACRRFVEAAATLGLRSPLDIVAALADVQAPLEALDEAVQAGVLERPGQDSNRIVAFTHPLARAAVYHGLALARRATLHKGAAGLVGDEATALRHRFDAALVADESLAAEVEAFAGRELQRGAWASASVCLNAASRLSGTAESRERRALDAVDALLHAGDGGAARRAAGELPADGLASLSAQRDAVLAYLAMFSGNVEEAEARLARAWETGLTGDLAATVALRRSFVAGLRFQADDFVEWARLAVTLAPADAKTRALAAVQISAGLVLQGRRAEAYAALDAELDVQPGGFALRALKGAMLFGDDDLAGARPMLHAAVDEARQIGSLVAASHSLAILAKLEFAAGRWDDAVVLAEQAEALAVESELPWLLAVTRWAALHVPLARGEPHPDLPSPTGTFERMIEVEACAHAEVAAAADAPRAVVAALAPLIEGPAGFWPWQPVYAEALIKLQRFDDADAILRAHAGRWSPSVDARLMRARARLEAALERPQAAEAAFVAALRGLDKQPYELALTELAYGQFLRRRRRRREATEQLVAARERLLALHAHPALADCERELAAAGLAPSATPASDGLTPQERAVARLVAAGHSNRKVADELLLSVRTVEAHLTKVYGKLAISSRAALAATYAEQSEDVDSPDATAR